MTGTVRECLQSKGLSEAIGGLPHCPQVSFQEVLEFAHQLPRCLSLWGNTGNSSANIKGRGDVEGEAGKLSNI